MKGIGRALAVLLLGFGLLVLFAAAEARRDPVVRRMGVRLPGWPAGAAPMKIALLSDIHIGSSATTSARLKRVVAQVNALHPDLVLIAGDFVAGHDPGSGRRYATMLRAPLAGLRAPLGTVAVLGNHDHWTAPAAIADSLRVAGIVVLANEGLRRGPLVLIGIDDHFSGHDDSARAIASVAGMKGSRLVLTHTPDSAVGLPRSAGALLLAGHTHCGQAVVPAVGSLANLRQGRRFYLPRYECGAVRDPDRLVVVTGGIGGSLPLRLGAPPDLWLLTIGP